MKKVIAIMFMVLSVLFILISPCIPHHHHDSVACVTMEHCDKDNVYNDKHTSHNVAHNANSKCADCNFYAVSKQSTSPNKYIATLLPLLFSITGIAILNILFGKTVKTTISYVNNYKFAYACVSNGLRAPPAVLSL